MEKSKDHILVSEIEELASEIKKGDLLHVNALPSSFVSRAMSNPFISGFNALVGRDWYVLVKTDKGRVWNAPLELVVKLNEEDVDESIKP